MLASLGYQLYALGKKEPPKQIELDGNSYQLEEILKHDFFAVTAIYKSEEQVDTAKPEPTEVVLKLAREQNILGLPVKWLGEILCQHEVSIIKRLSHLKQVPHLVSCYGKSGFIYEYIKGQTLKEVEKPTDTFFDEALELLQQIHQCDIAYVDMNKRSNIIVGPDGKPSLIDFQISLYIPERFIISQKLSCYLRSILQKADIYHLLKHKRRLRPELLRPNEEALSHCNSLIRIHRKIATPLRTLRRAILKYFHKNELIPVDKETQDNQKAS